jgi:hypothetical protein
MKIQDLPAKSKWYVIAIGELANTAKKPICIHECWSNGTVTFKESPKKRKEFSFNKLRNKLIAQTYYSLLVPQDAKVYVDSDSKTGFIGNGYLNFWHNEEVSKDADEAMQIMFNELISKCYRFSDTIKTKVKFWAADRKSSVDITNKFKEVFEQLPLLEDDSLAEKPTEKKPKPLMKDPLSEADWEKLKKAGPEYWPPIVKLFNPCGAQTWWIAGCDPENPDLLTGVADLGFGIVEAGTVSMNEIRSITGPLGIGIEKDQYFDGTDYTFDEVLSMDRLPTIARRAVSNNESSLNGDIKTINANRNVEPVNDDKAIKSNIVIIGRLCDKENHSAHFEKMTIDEALNKFDAFIAEQEGIPVEEINDFGGTIIEACLVSDSPIYVVALASY